VHRARARLPYTTLFRSLRQAAGPQGNITFAVGRDVQGVAVPSGALAPPNAAPNQNGVLRTNTVTGATQIDPNIDFVGANALPEEIGRAHVWTPVTQSHP